MVTHEIPANSSRKPWGHLIRNLLILLAIIGGFTFAAFAIAAFYGWLAQPESRVAVFLVGSILGEWVALAVLVRLNKAEDITFHDLGWGKPANLKAFAISLIVFIVYSAITAMNPRVGSHLLDWSVLKLLALMAAITAGIVEETIFRGYIITSLERMKYREITQVVVSGLIFAMAHIYGFASPISYLISMGYTSLLGAALAIVYLLGKKSLTPVILCHFLIDAAIEPWLLLSFFTGPG